MIHDLMDQLLPPVSDDEDDDQPTLEFVFEAVPAPAPKAKPGSGYASDQPPVAAGVPAASRCRTLVVCPQGGATAFATAAFPLRPVPWSLRVKALPTRCLPKPPKPTAFFVPEAGSSENMEVAFAMLDGPVAAEYAVAWVEALLESFPSATEVIFLDCLFRNEFCRPAGYGEPPQEPHLCGLWTSAWATADSAQPVALQSVAQLPTPNVVQGVAAALLTQCEAERKRCLVGLALQDGAHLSAACLRAFAGLKGAFEVVGLLPLKVDRQWPPSCVDALEKIVPPFSMSIYA